MSFEPQVPTEHYFKGYDTKERWMSYWHQINEVLNTGGKNILEVGMGNGTVADYLRRSGLEVITVDIDPALKPDYVCSVTELTKIFQPDSFDVVLCAEVLEHIPFEHFEKALTELHRVCKQFLVISLPDSRIGLLAMFRFPKIGVRTIVFKVVFPRKHRFDGEHYWEIGKRGYSLGRITRILEKKFIIAKSFIPSENMYHIFFVLRKR